MIKTEGGLIKTARTTRAVFIISQKKLSIKMFVLNGLRTIKKLSTNEVIFLILKSKQILGKIWD